MYETGTSKASGSANGKVPIQVSQDRRILGRTGTLQERSIDFGRLRRQRLEKVQSEMRSRQVGALLLTDTMNIRYTTGVSIMPIWTSTNLAHYVLVPAEGSPVLFEMARRSSGPKSSFRMSATPTIGRPASRSSWPPSDPPNGRRR